MSKGRTYLTPDEYPRMYRDAIVDLLSVFSNGDIFEALGRITDVKRAGDLLNMAMNDIDADITASLHLVPQSEKFKSAIDSRIPEEDRARIVAVDMGGRMLDRVGLAQFRLLDPAESFHYILEWKAADGSSVIRTTELISERDIESKLVEFRYDLFHHVAVSSVERQKFRDGSIHVFLN
ncbi:MAG: hypothetical protein Q8K28_15400 [Hoeflea sp.]|uniref:hypothetical protein n=1 Tax=Hoeflea sp. TaxID=1940281 RepID=UPI0027310BF1|nr:hypothetical protein [Hoeflea sp.]MDP2121281.1 hypothetical protein [Hoeflea sp.]